MVLSDFLQTSPLEFQQTIKEWPADLYDLDKIIPAVMDKVGKGEENRGEGFFWGVKLFMLLFVCMSLYLLFSSK